MLLDMVDYLSPPKAAQPQGKVRLNRRHPLAPLSGIFLQESAYGRVCDLVSGSIGSAIGSTVTSGIIAQGRYLNHASTGRNEVAIPAAAESCALTIVCGVTSPGATNGRILEFYTDSGKATTKGRLSLSTSTISFEIAIGGGNAIWTVTGLAAGRRVVTILWKSPVSPGTPSSGNCTIYVDEVLQSPSFSNNGGSVNAGDFRYAVVGNRTAGDRPLANKIDFIWLDTKLRSVAEALSIGAAPYQMLERDLPPLIGVTAAGGGTSYSASLALGLQMATNDNAVLAATGGISLGMAAGVSEAGNMSALSALTLGLGMAITSASIDTMSGALNLGVIAGAGVNGGQLFQVNIPLGLIAGLQSGAKKNYSASLALSLSIGQAIAGVITAHVSPSARILPVQAENRHLIIKVEDRILVIEVENRTINIKLE
jgi:hypothetical protein